jgi:hypothetical protein
LTSALHARRIFVVLAGLLAAISFLKALRFPNRWAATNFVLNYSQGFVRRGLVGEVARTVLGDATFHYRVFVAFSFLVMAVSIGGFVWLARRALAERGADLELRSAILVFLASPALVLLVHLVGYLDYLGLAFITLFAAAAPTRAWVAYGVAALAGVVLAFVHEAQTLLFMPVVLFILACRALALAQRTPASGGAPRGWSTGLLLTAVLSLALGASAYVSLAGEAQRVAALQRWLNERVDFTTHYGVFRALKTGSPVGLLDVMWRFWSDPGRLIWWFKALVLFAPSYVFLIIYGWRALATAVGAARRSVAALRALFLLACLSPLSLNVVAWDYARWFALGVVNALVCILGFHAACRVPASRDTSRPPWLPLAAGVVVALGLASDGILFNNARLSYYPFFDQWQALAHLLESGTIQSPAD